jgi:hypothetical protein
VVNRWRVWIEADFERFVVVRLNSEARHKAVDHQFNVVTHEGLRSRILLRRAEQQALIKNTIIIIFHSKGYYFISFKTFRSLIMLWTRIKAVWLASKMTLMYVEALHSLTHVTAAASVCCFEEP